jgi:protein-arginine kinase activator protein McsA
MEDQLQKAIENEDYERAAQLRDEIDRVKKEN